MNKECFNFGARMYTDTESVYLTKEAAGGIYTKLVLKGIKQIAKSGKGIRKGLSKLLAKGSAKGSTTGAAKGGNSIESWLKTRMKKNPKATAGTLMGAGIYTGAKGRGFIDTSVKFSKLPYMGAGITTLAGVPAGAGLFLLGRAMKERSQSERKKERELAFYTDKLEENETHEF